MDKVEVGQFYYVTDLNNLTSSYRVQVLEIINSKVAKVINSPKSSKQHRQYRPFNIPILDISMMNGQMKRKSQALQ